MSKGRKTREKRKKDIVRNKPKNTIRGETTYREKGKNPSLEEKIQSLNRELT